MNDLIWTEDDGKGHRTDLIVDYGGDMNLLIHKGNKLDDFSLKGGNLPDPSSMDNVDSKIAKTIIKRQLEGGYTDKWNKISNTCMGVSEDTSMGFHRLYTMDKKGTNHQK